MKYFCLWSTSIVTALTLTFTHFEICENKTKLVTNNPKILLNKTIQHIWHTWHIPSKLKKKHQTTKFASPYTWPVGLWLVWMAGREKTRRHVLQCCRVLHDSAVSRSAQTFPQCSAGVQSGGCRLQSAAWLESGPDRRRALCLHMRPPVCRSAECKHGRSSILIFFRYSQTSENSCWKHLSTL